MGACVFVCVSYCVYVCICDIYTHILGRSAKERDSALCASFLRGAHMGACVFVYVFYYVYLYIHTTRIHV